MLARFPAYDNASKTTISAGGSALRARAKLLPMKPAPPVMSHAPMLAAAERVHGSALGDTAAPFRRPPQREVMQPFELATAERHGIEHEPGDDAHEREDHEAHR